MVKALIEIDMKHSNLHLKPEHRIISWGKYANKKFSEVPTEYLEWFINNAYSQMVNRKEWAEEELKRRKITHRRPFCNTTIY